MGKVFIPLPFAIDLARPLEKTPLHTLFCMNDKNAHRFELTISTLGAPQSLEGCSVVGYFLSFETMTTHRITGTATGGKAVVVLDDFCYSLHGQFALTIKIKEGDAETSVFCGEGYMRTTMSEKVITDGYIILNAEEILRHIEAMDQATKDVTEAVKNAEVWANAAAQAETLETGKAATVTVKDVDGKRYIIFGIPQGKTGPQGNPGVGIQVIDQTVFTTDDKGINEFTALLTDGTKKVLKVVNGGKGSAGKDGVGIESCRQAVTSNSDGGANTVEIILTDGTVIPVTIKNGSKGATGAAGHTPVKGTDYFTAAEKTEMMNAVKAQMASETWTFTLANGSTVNKVVPTI